MIVEVRSHPRPGYVECFISAAPSAGGPADDVFAAVATELATTGAVPVREKVYGSRAARERLLRARAREFGRHDLDADTPVGFVDGAPPGDGELAGVQVWGVRADDGHAITTVEHGRLWTAPGFRMLHLTGITGRPDTCITEQARRMFDDAVAAARAQDFAFGRTVRTWIYLARLLDWYGEFNRVRSEAYREHDFAPPASTGIQGHDGGECTMDALLVDGMDCRLIDGTARQGSACSYGSRFSRGVVLEHPGGRTVHVSGTASIDGAGRSLHPDDPAAQCAEMLLCVGAVLAEAGMTLADICEATLFCKDERAMAACAQVRELLGIAAFPTIAVRADVCRPELLVEMEAVACR